MCFFIFKGSTSYMKTQILSLQKALILVSMPNVVTFRCFTLLWLQKPTLSSCDGQFVCLLFLFWSLSSHSRIFHWPTVYNGHLRGLVTLTPNAERLAVPSCHYLFLRLRSLANGDRTPISRMRGERSILTAAVPDGKRESVRVKAIKNNINVMSQESLHYIQYWANIAI